MTGVQTCALPIYNTALGAQSLYSNTTASYNTAVGYQAAYANTTGVGLVAVGRGALYGNTTGYGNVAVGDSPLNSNTTGAYNVAIGSYVSGGTTSPLVANSTGSNNVAIGSGALSSNTTAWLPLTFWLCGPLRAALRFDFHPEIFMLPLFLFATFLLQELSWKKRAGLSSSRIFLSSSLRRCKPWGVI